MQLFAEKGDFSNKKRPKRDPNSGLGLLRDPGHPNRDPVGSSGVLPPWSPSTGAHLSNLTKTYLHEGRHKKKATFFWTLYKRGGGVNRNQKVMRIFLSVPYLNPLLDIKLGEGGLTIFQNV